MDPRIRNISLRGIARALADLVMPRTCVVCGGDLLAVEEHICSACAADLPLTHFAPLRDNPMAQSFNFLVQSEIALAGNDAVYEPYGYAASLFYYRAGSAYSRITRRLKYHRWFGQGRFFSHMLGRALAASPLFRDVALVIPVPLFWTRRLRRGYNQAEIIARAVADALPGASLCTDVLRRVRHTKTQTRLGAALRYKNVKSAFVASGAKLSKLEAPHLLLVDDVFTTGATLCACQRALRAVVPEGTRISVATLAFVGR